MAERRSDYLGLRLSAAEKQAVQEWADKEQRSASDMARLLIGEALEIRAGMERYRQDAARVTAALEAQQTSRARPVQETVRTTEHKGPLRSNRQDCPAEGFTPQKPGSPRCVCGLTQKHHIYGGDT